MPTRPSVETSAETLREALEGIAAVQRAVVEGPPWRVLLVCDSAARSEPIETTAFGLLSAQGVAAGEVELVTSFLAPPEPRRRIRLVSASLRHPRVHLAEATTTLEWKGRIVEGRAEGQGGPGSDPRICALAALNAVEKLVPAAPRFLLVGVKSVRVFDHDLFVTLVRSEERPDQPLVGACLVTADFPHSVAVAVLNGLNRMLGNYLSVGE